MDTRDTPPWLRPWDDPSLDDPTDTKQYLIEDPVIDLNNLGLKGPFQPFEPEPLPEAESFRAACATGDLDTIQQAFKTYWDDVASDLRPRKSDLLDPGIVEIIKQDQRAIFEYLVPNIRSLSPVREQMIVKSKAYSIMELWLEQGWDIKAKLSQSSPPALSLAVQDEELTRWLLAHGADPNAKNEVDVTPLSIAVCDAPFETIKLLFDHGGTTKHGHLLHYAIYRELPDRLEVFKWIFEKGGFRLNDIMYQNDPYAFIQNEFANLCTPLHSAARRGYLEIVEILLKNGADPGVKSSLGYLPIMDALANGFHEVADRLSTNMLRRIVDHPIYHRVGDRMELRNEHALPSTS
ncbi:MAG: hypothetical protein Q9174_003784 [Haloplaca sp. 1 TL-2023]